MSDPAEVIIIPPFAMIVSGHLFGTAQSVWEPPPPRFPGRTRSTAGGLGVHEGKTLAFMVNGAVTSMIRGA